MDQTTRAFDLQGMRCRQTFRGHVESVNYVAFQPFSNNVLTASGDKTVSLWDLRTGLCVQTFYGHGNACNQARSAPSRQFSAHLNGSRIAWKLRVFNRNNDPFSNTTQSSLHGHVFRAQVVCHPGERLRFELVSTCSWEGSVHINQRTQRNQILDECALSVLLVETHASFRQMCSRR